MNEASFKSAMRRMAATVTIISTGSSGQRFGMTATAVTSVSMDPPSLLVCVNRSASIHDPIREAGRFCVNLLSASHQAHCSAFSGKEKGEDRFRFGAWHSHGELPYLSDAQANIFCDVDVETPYGSHTVFIGRVTDCMVRGTPEPLMFVDGRFAENGVSQLEPPAEPWPVSPHVLRHGCLASM